MPTATVWIECSFELGSPDDYPDEVSTWEAAARCDAAGMSIDSELCDLAWSVSSVSINGGGEFVREEGK